jgi:hypothetical protein
VWSCNSFAVVRGNGSYLLWPIERAPLNENGDVRKIVASANTQLENRGVAFNSGFNGTTRCPPVSCSVRILQIYATGFYETAEKYCDVVTSSGITTH